VKITFQVFYTTVILLSYVQVIFFGGGWVFFLKKLFRDYEVSRDISCIYEVLWNLFECILHLLLAVMTLCTVVSMILKYDEPEV